MKLLAIDTATEACSAALYVDGNILEKYEVAPQKHAELILPMVDAVLAEAEMKLTSLDGLAFGRGPGAFTGVRIASAVVQGLAFASDLPVVPVSTLAALAQGAVSESSTIISAIDARMGEIYCGVFSVGADAIVSPLSSEEVGKPEAVSLEVNAPCFGAGTGWAVYAEILSARLGANLTGVKGNCLPRASDMLPLALKQIKAGKQVPAGQALPVYLRNRVTG